jgi:hypothetical protein
MKKLFLSIFGLLNLVIVFSQTTNTISSLTNSNQGLIKGFNLSFYHNDAIYHSNCLLSDNHLWRLDLNTGKDSLLFSLPFSVNTGGSLSNGILSLFPGAVTVNNDAYLLNNDNTFRKYNLVSNSWQSLTPLPSTYDVGKKAIVYDGNNFIYVWGGRTRTSTPSGNSAANLAEHSNQLWRYSINTNTWFLLSTAPARLICQEAIYSYPFIYFAGGGVWSSNGGPNFNTVYKYNLLNNSWSTITAPYTFVQIAGQLPSYFLFKDRIYTFHPYHSSAQGLTSYLGYLDANGTNWIRDTINNNLSIHHYNFYPFDLLYPNVYKNVPGALSHLRSFDHKNSKVFIDDYWMTGSFDFAPSNMAEVKVLSPKR